MIWKMIVSPLAVGLAFTLHYIKFEVKNSLRHTSSLSNAAVVFIVECIGMKDFCVL